MYLLTQIARFLFILFVFLFALMDYTYLLRRKEEKKKRLIGRQIRILYLMLFLAAVLILINDFSILNAFLLAGIFLYIGITLVAYRLIYPRASMLLVNNMLFLLLVGFIMIIRIILFNFKR